MDNEQFKTIEIDDRTFILNKFTALTGSFVLFKLTKIITPIIDTLKNVDDLTKIKIEDINLTELASSLFTLEEKEFKYIQNQALMTVKQMLPAGPVPIINEFGTWGVEGLEYDVQTVLNLTLKALVFNIVPFFAGLNLESLTKGLTSSLQNLKT